MKAFKSLFKPATPWRIVQTDDKDSYLDSIKKFQLTKDEVQHIRIMLYGPTGSGKSSFINSVERILRDRVTSQALSDSIGGSSFTKKYRTHSIKKDSSSYYPFVFTDVMGLEKERKKGACPEDIALAFKGHVKDGYTVGFLDKCTNPAGIWVYLFLIYFKSVLYFFKICRCNFYGFVLKFNPQTSISPTDPFYNSSPTMNDKTHVLVCVVSASTGHLLGNEHLEKIRDVRLEASDLGIPQIVVLTKIDEACPEVHLNIKKVFTSNIIKKE
ncbi:interferon-induced protein 44-like isoform X1 [Boleophthalmus pectinirostris]|uniref:interferon-induced protein 44-like isoform X1 n=1 Tax=Boleophthalmus pectinirostris TaxID=150288 RepID=UPI002431DB51|nr:interferon-induced protein 44-like isoform X1 [Boleophthalmus pectinirostris]XP_055008676.1 interferon-induced protein 44-like isoform X1 [Boleophthalmus pectinirostris]